VLSGIKDDEAIIYVSDVSSAVLSAIPFDAEKFNNLFRLMGALSQTLGVMPLQSSPVTAGIP